ncbi:MAG TPA: DNA primase [Vicinamibacterales bacterium]|nr:DNA primase [Vicinamibacterales bacterium]
MGFPQSFIDDLRMQADILQVVQEYVSLRKSGATFKGLCPFHSEKSPSFHVNRDKGFFHCFGCGAGGDVFKFLELQEKLGFVDAVKHLASKFGMPLPEQVGGRDAHADAAEREAMLKAHERALEYFQAQLASPAGRKALRMLQDRGITSDTIKRLGIGYAPPAYEGLKTTLVKEGLPLPLLVRSGLAVERDNGQTVDRFRGRLMIPIARDSGSIVAFGGRAMEKDQQPKYLNSPETTIYSKGKTLYGLNFTKADIRRLGYAVLVEGYFDFAQLLQAGITPIVASSGTALTPAQAQLLRRFTSKVILSFDPDAAGQGAAARSCELLVAEGFEVNVAVLPPGDDPDSVIQKRGRDAYLDLLKNSRPYLEYLLDRAAAAHDLNSDEGRRQFLTAMLAVAARIPDPAARDQFGDRLAHKARITEEVVRAEVRKAAVQKRPELTAREMPNFGQVKQAEKGLIWALIHEPEQGLAALKLLQDNDLDGLPTRHILEEARNFAEKPPAMLPTALLERLTSIEAQLVTGIAAEPSAPWSAISCARELQQLRVHREFSAIQREIARLQESGAAPDRHLLEKKLALARELELLSRTVH